MSPAAGKKKRTGVFGGPVRKKGGMLPAWFWLVLLFLLGAMTAVLAVSCGKQGAAASAVPRTKIRRARLETQTAWEESFFTDRLGWLEENKGRAEGDIRYFREKTGVQPYFYIRSAPAGAAAASEEEMETAARSLCGRLFRDENHLLILVDEGEDREPLLSAGFAAGKNAARVMDREAMDILAAYWALDMGSGEGLTQPQKAAAAGDALRRTADNIMMVRHTAGWIWLLVILCLGILTLAGLAFRQNWLRLKKEK